MSALPSLKRGFLFNALYTAQNFVIPIASFAYLSRVLGPAYLGKINFISSLATYFTFLASLALPLYGTRAIAKSRNDGAALNRTWSELFLLQAGATLLACSLYASLYFLFPRLREEPVLFALGGGILFCAMLSADWLLTGLERYGILFSRDALLKSASLVLLFLLVGGPGDYTRFMGIGLGIAAASGAWGLIQARAFVRPEWRGLAPAAHLPSLSVMLACSLTSGVYAYLDNVVVGFLTDDHSVGLYAAATRTNRMVVIFLTSLGTAIIPRLSYYSQQNMADESRKVAAKTIRFMFLIAWPVSFLFLALAPQILELISGRDFLPAAGAMRISVPVIAASVFTNYLAFHVLFPIGGEKSVLLGTSLAAVINLLANLLLIPAWGIEGAALASVLGQLACGAVLWAGARRRGLLPNPWEGSANYLAAAAVLALAAWLWVGFAAPRPNEILLFFAGSACAYCGFLYLIRDSLAVQILESAMGRFLKRSDV